MSSPPDLRPVSPFSSSASPLDDASLPALPEDLRRHLQLELERVNVGSIYVPLELVWAIGIGGALVSAAVTLSPWTCWVKRSVRDHPFDPSLAKRERAASLPTSSMTRRTTSPAMDRRASSPTMPVPRRQDSTSSASSHSYDSGVGGLHSILHAPVGVAGSRKPRRHVSFKLSDDQESLASLSDVEVEELSPGMLDSAVEAEALRFAVEEELVVEHKAKRHGTWKRWCPLCSRSRKKPSPPPPTSPQPESSLHDLIAKEFASNKSTRHFTRSPPRA